MSHDPQDDTSLRWQLRQLPRERDTARELWPDIAARIRREPRDLRPARPRWPVALGLAASLAVAMALGWQWLTPAAPVGEAPTLDALVAIEFERAVLRQAGALAREYEAAIAQFTGAPLPEAVTPSIEELDRSTREILAALEADPGAVFLLDQLRRTYAKRLSLTQQAALG